MLLNISIVIKIILLQNLFLMFLILRYSNSFNIEEDNIDLPYNLGYSQGIHKGTDSISRDTLQKILLGVEKGDKDNIYFYGLLKLYGISLSQDSSVAAEYFLRAAKLGHKEATTAYGVSLLYGYGVEKDTVAATKWFRNGITLGDMVLYYILLLLRFEIFILDTEIFIGFLLVARKVRCSINFIHSLTHL